MSTLAIVTWWLIATPNAYHDIYIYQGYVYRYVFLHSSKLGYIYTNIHGNISDGVRPLIYVLLSYVIVMGSHKYIDVSLPIGPLLGSKVKTATGISLHKANDNNRDNNQDIHVVVP